MQRTTISVQEELSLSERANEEFCAQKTHLEQLLQKAKEVQERLQAELTVLREERKETQEVMSQVRADPSSLQVRGSTVVLRLDWVPLVFKTPSALRPPLLLETIHGKNSHGSYALPTGMSQTDGEG